MTLETLFGETPLFEETVNVLWGDEPRSLGRPEGVV
jgi:hypothetical protein